MKTNVKRGLAAAMLGIATCGLSPQTFAHDGGGDAFFGALLGSTLGTALGAGFAPPEREVVVVQRPYYQPPPPRVVVIREPDYAPYYAPEREVVVVRGPHHHWRRGRDDD